jgi:hypothetical protein
MNEASLLEFLGEYPPTRDPRDTARSPVPPPSLLFADWGLKAPVDSSLSVSLTSVHHEILSAEWVASLTSDCHSGVWQRS